MTARIGILISGRGSNMQSLHKAMLADDFPAELVCVLSNTPDAAGLDYAREHGIAAQAIDHRNFDQREEFEAELDKALRAAQVDVICLAGFMRILSPFFVRRWPGKILNIHPSLLPSFAGLHTHKRALQAGCKVHGCSVHVVTEELDDGPILGQAVIPVFDGDTPDTLAKRVLSVEHELYPRALHHFLQPADSQDGTNSTASQSDSLISVG